MRSSSSPKLRVPKTEWRNVAVHLLATSDRVNGLELEGFGLEYSELLKEYTHGSFSNVASILFDGFTQYLPMLCLWHLLPAFLMMAVPWTLMTLSKKWSMDLMEFQLMMKRQLQLIHLACLHWSQKVLILCILCSIHFLPSSFPKHQHCSYKVMDGFSVSFFNYVKLFGGVFKDSDKAC
ncbi:hypothetical protein Tsubulata_021065 [Turnera subulata]|uniref:Uncharacterized protein n=1 Tax=Turnera subulata TaxID=218843 RepID=A0A9Q0FLK0_9ROSI|nr:hypothetical protein Tsubulata_021065 [Turnera subulata]